MYLFENLEKDNLHHAYLIESIGKETSLELKKFIMEKLEFEIRSNPDFWYGEFDTFGIKDGRSIKQMQSREAFLGAKKIFVITANFFTIEAQNSLLKMFEEPTGGTHFFVITQNVETLLPTLRSRMLLIRNSKKISQKKDESKLDYPNQANDSLSEIDVGLFLKSNKSKRIAMLKEIIEQKDKNSAILFLNELEKAIGADTSKENIYRLREIMKCKKYLNGASPSVKMILEHISLIV